MNTAYIYDAVRTPRGKGKASGTLHKVTPVQLVVNLLKALQKRNNLDTSKINDMALGCVTQIKEQGGNVAKACTQNAGYDDSVAAYTLNRFCASGLEAVNSVTANVMAGMAELAIGGGLESMSRAKMGSDGGAWYMDPAVALPGYFVPQGISADLIATKFGFSRNDVDSFAVESQKRAANARENGYFKQSLVPVTDPNGLTILDHDEFIRPGTTVEKLGELQPSFEMMGQMAGFDNVAIQKYPEVENINHVHHAGNSSGIVDGSGLVLIGNERIGKELGLTPRAKIRSYAMVGTEPTIMLLGPAPSTRKALEKAGLTKNDIDLYEVNEAFAAVVLRFMQDMDIPHDKVNVNGGAIAMGHPLGATGAII
ncbi:MAG: acetyl-CoA C-acetyltransferase, partial [Bacteroidota bacterium]